MFILVSTSPLEFVNGELENVLWWALLPNDMMWFDASYFSIVNVVVGVDKLLVNNFDSIDSILYYHSEKEKRWSEMDYCI